MAAAYKILGQTLPTANTLSNVYVVPTATSTILNDKSRPDVCAASHLQVAMLGHRKYAW